jgi:hypothetical protein
MNFGNYEAIFSGADLRIKLDDTSTDPVTNRDWQFIVNDAAYEFFTIYDNEASTFPFIIDGGAPSRAFQIRSDGNIATGSTGSSASITITRGDTPRIRFEQDGSNGETPHEWSILANETNFYVRDRTNNVGPFYIYPGTGNEGALTIGGDGQVGLGTYSAQAQLHVTNNDGSAKILVEETGGGGAQELFQMKSNGGSYFTLTNTTSGRDWFFTHENNVGGRFIITSSTNPSQGLFLTPDGNMSIGGTLTTGGGTCGGGCDRVFTEQAIIPAPDYAAKMWGQGFLPHVGPTPEGAPINVSEKLGGMLNALEHAHVFIDEQRREIASLEAKVTRLSALELQISELSARLAKVEEN